jgi:hypothetical protein
MIRALLLPIVLAFAAEAAIAQTSIELEGLAEPAPVRAIPRTPDGRPDFGGGWSTAFITPVARMDGAKSVVVSDVEAGQLARGFVEWAHSRAADVVVDPEYFISGADTLLRVNGEWRSSQITTPADGVQHYTAEGKRLETQKRDWSGAFADGPEMRPPFERCLVSAGSAPLTTVPGALIREVIQTPDHIVLASDGGDTRIIGLHTAPRPAAITSYLGDSTARWEGDVLVVQTTSLKTHVQRGIITRPQSRVVERFELLGPDELLYRFTVEDAAIYAEPWSAEFVLMRSKERVLEYACHEHNYSMVNILQAGRVADAKAAKAKRRSR